MAHGFRPYSLEQGYLLPVDAREWVPAGHLALFVADAVAEMDLQPLLRTYAGGRGPRGYHPQMLLTVLLYGYCVGVMSTRRLAARCETDLAFRMLSGGATPDFRTLAEFRKRHLAEMNRLFVEVLRLCEAAGLVQVGHLSLDGSKYQANASKHKAMSYGRMGEEEERLTALVKEVLAEAEATDRAEDAEHGPERRGDEVPPALQRREERLRTIRAAKARLEEEARRQAAAREADGEGSAPAEGAARPEEKAQSNFTDPESRIMKTAGGWVQGYNTQVMADEASGVIVACEVSAEGTDCRRLVPMLEQTEANLKAIGRGWASGETQPIFSADAGYCSEANLAELERRSLDAYVATGRERQLRSAQAEAGSAQSPRRAAMREKLQTERGRAIYARRKCITEPIHGHIKQARQFRQFHLRGLRPVTAEFTLVALTHNLLKLWRARTQAAMTPA